MSKFIKAILEETGAMDKNGKTNISAIKQENGNWIIYYKKGLLPDEFEYFNDLYEHLLSEYYEE